VLAIRGGAPHRSHALRDGAQGLCRAQGGPARCASVLLWGSRARDCSVVEPAPAALEQLLLCANARDGSQAQHHPAGTRICATGAGQRGPKSARTVRWRHHHRTAGDRPVVSDSPLLMALLIAAKRATLPLGIVVKLFSRSIDAFLFSSMEFNECLVSILRAFPLPYWQSAYWEPWPALPPPAGRPPIARKRPAAISSRLAAMESAIAVRPRRSQAAVKKAWPVARTTRTAVTRHPLVAARARIAARSRRLAAMPGGKRRPTLLAARTPLRLRPAVRQVS
jgi:hypothetical protein